MRKHPLPMGQSPCGKIHRFYAPVWTLFLPGHSYFRNNHRTISATNTPDTTAARTFSKNCSIGAHLLVIDSEDCPGQQITSFFLSFPAVIIFLFYIFSWLILANALRKIIFRRAVFTVRVVPTGPHFVSGRVCFQMGQAAAFKPRLSIKRQCVDQAILGDNTMGRHSLRKIFLLKKKCRRDE